MRPRNKFPDLDEDTGGDLRHLLHLPRCPWGTATISFYALDPTSWPHMFEPCQKTENLPVFECQKRGEEAGAGTVVSYFEHGGQVLSTGRVDALAAPGPDGGGQCSHSRVFDMHGFLVQNVSYFCCHLFQLWQNPEFRDGRDSKRHHSRFSFFGGA